MGRASRNLYRIWGEEKNTNEGTHFHLLPIAVDGLKANRHKLVRMMTIDRSSSINYQLNKWDDVLTSFYSHNRYLEEKERNIHIYIYILSIYTYRLYKLIIRLLPLYDRYANESIGRMYAMFFCLCTLARHSDTRSILSSLSLSLTFCYTNQLTNKCFRTDRHFI